MTTLSEIAGNRSFRVCLPVAMAAAGTDDEYEGFVAETNLKLTGVNWIPGAAVTANGTNFTILSVRNRKADASGAALPASRSYAATNSAAHVAEAMTLSATAADLLIAAGDVITVQRVHTASGVVVPAGVLEIICQVR
jgi:hypothetical protein